MAPAEIAAWGIAGFLSGGVLAGLHAPFFYFLLSVAVFGTIIFFRPKNKLIIFLVFCAVFVGGIYYRAFFKFTAGERVLPDQLDFSGVIWSEPQVSQSRFLAKFNLDPPYAGQILILLPSGTQAEYGDKLLVNAGILPVRSERDLPMAISRKTSFLASGAGNPWMSALLQFKEFNLAPIRKILSGEEGAFLEGILLGYKNDFSAVLKEDMKRSGTTHLVALSGYNVSILVVVLHGIMLRVISRRKTFYFLCAIIILFALMVGAESSIVRAAIMGVMVLLARELGRLPSFGFAMLWTAFVMDLWNPGVLFEPGFLLSFASLLGIVYLAPALKFIFKITEENKVADYVFLTISAQLATLPVIALIFGQISWAAIFSNLLILPVVPLLMGLGFILMGLNLFLPILALPLVPILQGLLAYVLTTIHFAAGIASPVSLSSIPFWGMALYALVVIIFSMRYGPQGQK